MFWVNSRKEQQKGQNEGVAGRNTAENHSNTLEGHYGPKI